ncbi:MAG: histidine phosphatase family protein [Burkholderiales bacterium]
MEVFLIRHTRPAVVEGTCYGRTDVPLDEHDFAARVPHIAAQLPRGMAFYSSPATRCARLAGHLVDATCGALAGVDERLRELDFGSWEGRLWSELPSEETRRWRSDIVHGAPPGGENLMALWARVTEFYQATLDDAHNKGTERIAIVGHAGSLKMLVMRALRMSPDAFALTDVAQGRVSRVDVTRRADGELRERLMFLNR